MPSDSEAASIAAPGDVSLDRYAAVQAAVAETVPLLEALALHGLAPHVWTAADVAWKKRIASEDATLEDYRRDLAAAEDRWDRRVRPVDEDVGAWIALLDVLASNPDASSLGIRGSDVSRLARKWARRMAEDRRLVAKVKQLRENGPGPLPTITVHEADSSIRFVAVPAAPMAVEPPQALPRAGEDTTASAAILPLVAQDTLVEPAASSWMAESQTRAFNPRDARHSTMVLSAFPDLRTTPKQSSPAVTEHFSIDDVAEGEEDTEDDLATDNHTTQLPPLPRDRPALPFEARATPAPDFFALIEADRKERKGSPRRADLYETAPLPRLARAAVLPMAKPKTEALTLPDLTIEQYASLRADLNNSPEKAPAILARYGVDGDAALKTIELRFNEEIQRDPPLLARFLRALRVYQEWIKTQRKPA